MRHDRKGMSRETRREGCEHAKKEHPRERERQLQTAAVGLANGQRHPMSG